jgi:TatA/E family protein of Tat protein translocase
MPAIAQTGFMLGLFNLGGGEIILILALALILFGAKKLPDLAQGLGRGLLSFREALDETAKEAGKSTGIYGKAAAQALTPDNRVAELYDPAVLKDKKTSRNPSMAMRFILWLRRLARTILS